MNFTQRKTEIITTMRDLHLERIEETHGFRIALAIKERCGDRLLVSHGMLYRALLSLEDDRALESRRERDEEIPADDDRIRRKLYRLTGQTRRELSHTDVPLGHKGLTPELAIGVTSSA